jgi:hypothetical protein
VVEVERGLGGAMAAHRDPISIPRADQPPQQMSYNGLIPRTDRDNVSQTVPLDIAIRIFR